MFVRTLAYTCPVAAPTPHCKQYPVTHLPDLRGQGRGRALQAGEQLKCFDVEAEPGRCGRCPFLHGDRGWHGVVGGVHFHHPKLSGVKLQPKEIRGGGVMKGEGDKVAGGCTQASWDGQEG
jgi:hypothetical protein